MNPFDPDLTKLTGGNPMDAYNGGVVSGDSFGVALLKTQNAKEARERLERVMAPNVASGGYGSSGYVASSGTYGYSPSSGRSSGGYGGELLMGLVRGIRNLLVLGLVLLMVAQLHPVGGVLVRGIGYLVAQADAVVSAPQRGNRDFYKTQLPPSLRKKEFTWGPSYAEQKAFLATDATDWKSTNADARGIVASMWAGYASGYRALEARTLPQSVRLGKDMESYLLAMAKKSGSPIPIQDLPAAYDVALRTDLEGIRQAALRAETILPHDEIVRAHADWARKRSTRVGTWIHGAGDRLCEAVASAYVRFGVVDKRIGCVN